MEYVADVMRRVAFGWNRKLRRELAATWGVSDDYMKLLSAEASKLVRAELTDPDVVAQNLAAMATAGIVEATKNGQSRSVERYANVLMKVTGIGRAAQVTTTNQTHVQVIQVGQEATHAITTPAMQALVRGRTPQLVVEAPQPDKDLAR